VAILFQEGEVLLLPDEPRPHHDCLEALALDCPQLAVRGSWENFGNRQITEFKSNFQKAVKHVSSLYSDFREDEQSIDL
jgi:hypothetical protein